MPDAPIYALPNGQFLVDATQVTRSQASAASIPLPGGGGNGGGNPPPPPPDIANYGKFMHQIFSIVDTNHAAANDTNIYNACLSFPDDTNTAPALQIERYGTNAVLIKASHFDYSAETDRDFALLICDKVETPTWKSIDLFGHSSDTQDGWLIQGLVSNWKVTDPMFLMVSNLNPSYSGFFRTIPYGGPQLALTGPAQYDTVSNTIAIQATVSDLSGTTNQQLATTVYGAPARYTVTSNNVINIDTRYAPSGIQQIEVLVANQTALVYDPQNPPSDIKTAYATTQTLPLDFENGTYVLFASDMCSPSVGTNYVIFVIDQGQNVTATIKDPSTGRTVKTLAGYVPYPVQLLIPWDFKETNGTPYTNDTYTVTFTAFAAGTTLTVTNQIQRSGVRPAAGNIVTYEDEDPSDPTGRYLDTEAGKYIVSLEIALYEALYYWDFASGTQYSPSDIGTYRDNPPWTGFPYVLTHGNEQSWASETCYALTNLAFSDFGFYMGHGNGTGIGGGPAGTSWVGPYMPSSTIASFVRGCGSQNWRMRKVVLWACYTDSPAATTAQGTLISWANAFGITATSLQRSSMMAKDVGLFFGGELPQGGYSGTLGGTAPEVATIFDDLWVTGGNPTPGGGDPTYAFGWAVDTIRSICPEINRGFPTWIGFGYLPYTANFDAEIVTNNISGIHW
ncbi:MAG TPA: hypothetical protein VN578_21250 [Candidatus Binatia bacterium]|nr:hypothetical protein [Candidatus Binatia bacterium]